MLQSPPSKGSPQVTTASFPRRAANARCEATISWTSLKGAVNLHPKNSGLKRERPIGSMYCTYIYLHEWLIFMDPMDDAWAI